MLSLQVARIRDAVVAGALAGIAAGLVFATLHAFIIVPIWDRMMGGLVFGAIAGAVGGWAYSELYPVQSEFPASMASGAKYGALLWLAVTPVSLVDAVVRATSLPRPDLFYDAFYVVLAALVGGLWGWRRLHRLRGIVAGIAAVVALTMAMGGPVPIGRNVWAFGIFLAVLPASMVAGAILGASVALTRRSVSAMAP